MHPDTWKQSDMGESIIYAWSKEMKRTQVHFSFTDECHLFCVFMVIGLTMEQSLVVGLTK